MASLRETRDSIVDMDDPAKVLRLADKYLQQMVELGQDFVLPADHIEIKAILEYYCGDLEGWRKFIKGVRELLPNRSDRQKAVQELYRTVDMRLSQQQRRDRITSAVNMAVRLGLVTSDVVAKQRYARRCTQYWTKLRLATTDALRSKTDSGRISRDELDEVMGEFWRSIDEGIANGEVPPP